jgi:tripartite-type tricarboxylate transporter receptor subunit TctC
MKQRAGVDILHVPYRGSADALTDLLSGTVQAMIEVVIFPHVKAGKLRLLAVMSETRDPVFPDTPTMDEAGFPGVAMPSWVGLYGPTGLPREIVMRLNKAVAEIGTTPDMTTRLLNADAVPHAQAPEDVAKSLRERIEVSRRIIATANIKPE